MRRISVLFLFAITAAGVVPSGGPKKSPRTSSILQIIFSFGLLKSAKSENYYRFSFIFNQRLIYLALFALY